MSRAEWIAVAAMVLALAAIGLSSCRFSGLDIEYGNDTITVGNGTLELPADD